MIIVAGRARKTTKEAVERVVGREAFVCEADAEAEFYIKNSRLPILVVSHVGEYHPDREFFAGDLEEAEKIIRLAGMLPPHAYLVLNFDDETVRDIKNQSKAKSLTYGFGVRAAVRATDVVLTKAPALGTNFKINYEGNIVPCWLKNLFGKEQIYSALAAAAVGQILDLNLVEVSAALKLYHGLPGRMQLIGGIKNTLILDDSENASSLSMAEALEVLRKIEDQGRKIAVLGDILGIGKYTIEAHEAIGEAAAKSADLLFTVGSRAKFFSQGAIAKGMSEDRIFQFDDVKEAGLALQKEMRSGDLVLVDGSKEMNMAEIVKEVRFE